MGLTPILMNTQVQAILRSEPVQRIEFFNRFLRTDTSDVNPRNHRLPSYPRVSACLGGSLYAYSRFSDGAVKSKLAPPGPEEPTRSGSSKPVILEPIRTLLLDNYDSYTYNLFQLLAVINGGMFAWHPIAEVVSTVGSRSGIHHCRENNFSASATTPSYTDCGLTGSALSNITLVW